MRAVAQNQRAARLMGISVERVYSSAWVLAAVVGAVAGVLIAPVIFLSSKMGLVAINGFTAAVLGGFGSLPGAVAGRHAPRRDREPGAALPADRHPLLGALPRHDRHPGRAPAGLLGPLERRKV